MGRTEARVYNANGTQATAEFKVSPGNDGNNEGYQPAVMALNSTRFVVVWANEIGGSTFEIAGRIYDRTGSPVGSQFSVGSLLSGSGVLGAQSEITRLDDGGFAATWRTHNGTTLGTRARVMNSDGTARSAELVLTGDIIADITSLSNGGFVVSYDSAGGLNAAIYNSSGTLTVPAFAVNTTTSAARYESTVTRSDDGFVVVWESSSGDGSGSAILAQRFDISGNKIGNEVLVNQTTTGNQQKPEVIETASGKVIAVWQSDNNSGAQGTGGALSATGSTTVSITAVNDEQVLATNSGASFAENSTGNVIDNSRLLTTDLDNTPGQIVYTVTAATTSGTLRRNGTALGVTDTFTQADINAGLLTYDHNGSETSSDSFSFSVDDGIGTTSSGTFNITVTPVNDNNPIITSNGGGATANINVAENTTALTTVTATDPDLPSQTLTYSDIGGDNVYDVIVRVSDGSLVDDQAIAVTIVDVSNFLVVDTTVDNDDSGILVGASYDIEWLNANKGADGYVSLREAIFAANNTAGTDSVTFNIPGTGVFTIQPNSALPTITDSIVLWLNKSGASGYENLIGRSFSDGTGWTVHLDPTGMLRLRVDTSTLTNQVSSSVATGLNDGNWHFAAVTLDLATRQVSINVDGGAATLANYSGDFAAPTGGSLSIGSGTVGANNYTGKLDQVQIFNHVLSSGEISDLYNNYSGTANILGNGGAGVFVNTGTGNVIGGATAGAGNVISGNLGTGVYVSACLDQCGRR